MLVTIKALLSKSNLELIDPIMNKIGFSSVTTTFGIQAAKAQEIIPPEVATVWGLSEYALALSIIGSILFIIEKVIVLYHRLKSSKKSEK